VRESQSFQLAKDTFSSEIAEEVALGAELEQPANKTNDNEHASSNLFFILNSSVLTHDRESIITTGVKIKNLIGKIAYAKTACS